MFVLVVPGRGIYLSKGGLGGSVLHARSLVSTAADAGSPSKGGVVSWVGGGESSEEGTVESSHKNASLVGSYRSNREK